MELNVEEALEVAVVLHKDGNLQSAEGYYRDILKSQPNHAEANHNLGVLVVSLGKPSVALPLLKTAVKNKPETEQTWLSYLDALIKEQHFDTAKLVIQEAKEQGFASEELLSLSSRLALELQDSAACSDSPPHSKLSTLLDHYNAGRLPEAEKLATMLTVRYEGHSFGWTVLGGVLRQTGRKLEALIAYQRAADLSPIDPEAFNNLGATFHELGRLEEAQKNFEKSITLRADFAPAYFNLGITLKENGKLEQAEANYIIATAISPDYAEAHKNLGDAIQEQGRLDEAILSYRQAIALKPDFVPAHFSLGVTYGKMGRMKDAEASYVAVLALNPEYAEAQHNLGVIVFQQGRLEEAQWRFEAAIKLRDEYSEAHCSMGVTLKEMGKLKEAEASFLQAIDSKSDYAEAYNNLGATLKQQGRMEEAELLLRKSIGFKPDYPEAHNNLGIVLLDMDRLVESESSVRQAIILKHDYAEAHNNLGVVLQGLGKIDEAEKSFCQAILLDPSFAEAYRHLTAIKKFKTRDEHYTRMQTLYSEKKISKHHRCHLNFALAKACDDLGDFKTAFKHLSEGNLLQREFLKYNITEDIELFNKHLKLHHKIEQNVLIPDNIERNLLPIFIVGMPRSGTTLVEQIISSHTQVTGAGELSFVAQCGNAVTRDPLKINREFLLKFRNNYLKKLQGLSRGNPNVTDKMPQNFLFIGLIKAAFPEAKIVHVKRNPAAVCWANYKQYFSSNIRYSNSLDDIVEYYKLYRHTMDFWENSLSHEIYNLDYELLTIDQENETRKLAQYLGLIWDKKCLSPQNNSRSVATASNIQVRQKIYKGSSEQWKNYKPFLDGALDNL